ncbi:MAG: hypothetical protein PHQ72_09555 [Hespellia sp.]|nr:hypothetical protein [Hespellia sp.]
MWNFIIRIMPVMGAYLVIRFIFWKKRNKDMENPEITSEYIIKSSGIVAGVFYAYTCFFLLLLYGCLIKYGLKDIFTIVCILFVVLGVIGSLNSIAWQVKVKNQNIIVRSTFGIKHYYSFNNITSGAYKKNGAFIVFVENKRIIKFDNNIPFEKFVAQMMQYNIPINYI